jgi:hypothetical protein
MVFSNDDLLILIQISIGVKKEKHEVQQVTKF